jgi:hypothetical protein
MNRRVAFLTVGAQKAATTSIAAYLAQYPDIRISVRKELHYFDSDVAFQGSSVDYDNYHQNFAD